MAKNKSTKRTKDNTDSNSPNNSEDNQNTSTSSNTTNSQQIDIRQLLETLNQLHTLREQLLQGEIASPGAWIHEYTIARIYPSGITHYYTYAKWQSQEPIFKRNPKKRTPRTKKGKDPEFTCHQHIGRTWSDTGLGADPLAIEAYEEYENRLRLEAVEEALVEVQRVLVVASKKLAAINRNRRFKFE